VPEFTDLPVFSLREVRRIAQLRWIEGESAVAAAEAGGLTIPPVQGYVLTHERPAAQTVLRASGDPLLAFHAYGLGQVGVLNTDLEGEGSREWLSWEELGKLIGPAIARVHRSITREHDITVQTAFTEGALFADVRDGNRWVSGLDVRAHVTGPVDAELTFSQTSVGRYRAHLGSLKSGLYTIHITVQRAGQTIAEEDRPLAVPYPEEYRRVGVDTERLSQIARTTGGQYLERPVLPPPSGKIAQESFTELWPWALSLALALFLLDLALRKLLVAR
jgi:hypothetical protein